MFFRRAAPVVTAVSVGTQLNENDDEKKENDDEKEPETIKELWKRLFSSLKDFHNLPYEEKLKLDDEFKEVYKQIFEKEEEIEVPTEEDRKKRLDHLNKLFNFDRDRNEIINLVDEGKDIDEAIEVVLSNRKNNTKSFANDYEEAYENAKPIQFHPKYKNIRKEDREKANELRKNGKQVFHPWYPTKYDMILNELQEEALLDAAKFQRMPFMSEDVNVYPYSKPITIVIDSDCLYDRRIGLKQGSIAFLSEAINFAEIILIGSQIEFFPAIGELDEDDYLILDPHDELFRNLSSYKLRDIRYLSRDPKRTIFIDSDPDNVISNPENAVIYPKHINDRSKRTLIPFVHFLEDISNKVATGGDKTDVRKIIEKYHNIEYDFMQQWQKVRRTGF